MTRITIEEVGETEPDSSEPGTPVFEAKTDHGSYIHFAFFESDPGVRVFNAMSFQDGDFSRLLDEIVDHFGETHIIFANVISDSLRDACEGFEEETREIPDGPHTGDEYQVLVGEWES